MLKTSKPMYAKHIAPYNRVCTNGSNEKNGQGQRLLPDKLDHNKYNASASPFHHFMKALTSESLSTVPSPRTWPCERDNRDTDTGEPWWNHDEPMMNPFISLAEVQLWCNYGHMKLIQRLLSALQTSQCQALLCFPVNPRKYRVSLPIDVTELFNATKTHPKDHNLPNNMHDTTREGPSTVRAWVISHFNLVWCPKNEQILLGSLVNISCWGLVQLALRLHWSLIVDADLFNSLPQCHPNLNVSCTLPTMTIGPLEMYHHHGPLHSSSSPSPMCHPQWSVSLLHDLR